MSCANNSRMWPTAVPATYILIAIVGRQREATVEEQVEEEE